MQYYKFVLNFQDRKITVKPFVPFVEVQHKLPAYAGPLPARGEFVRLSILPMLSKITSYTLKLSAYAGALCVRREAPARGEFESLSILSILPKITYFLYDQIKTCPYIEVPSRHTTICWSCQACFHRIYRGFISIKKYIRI